MARLGSSAHGCAEMQDQKKEVNNSLKQMKTISEKKEK
jgi:hypothetical protein